MQVSQVNEHITHAVIGGGKAIDFGISDSAEFFNILSSTLYKDQILSVVREVLCNAWDAHIEAGCTDRPVQVTLDNGKFIIKDFGKGIHHDDMGLIYGTYGNSTKKNDGTQTGGFGLGCKAPFAYTDHFEVTSSHGGIKTIYNLSKSSAQVMGKPGIIPIASFPTEETGLTVNIPINGEDIPRFAQLVERIASNGDMNMVFNGNQVSTLGFDTSKGNYLILRGKKLLDNASRIMVRYGNVVYPVDGESSILVNYNKIVNHLTLLNDYRYGAFQIVFQAPPHSISVTPSRESLSMQGHTINTLNKLFTDFLNILNIEFIAMCSKQAKEIVKEAVDSRQVAALLKRESSLPGKRDFTTVDTIPNLEVMTQIYLCKHYPKGLKYRKADLIYRLTLMAQHGLLNKGLVQTLVKTISKVTTEVSSRWIEQKDTTSWLQKRIIAPLMVSLEKTDLDSKKLYACDPDDLNAPERCTDVSPALVSAVNVCPTHIFNTLPYLRNIIVLTTKRIDLVSRVYAHDDFDESDQYQGFMVYIVGRKAGEVDKAREFFTNAGMRLIDLTIKEANSGGDYGVARKPTKKGLVCLSNVSTSSGFDIQNRLNDDAVRISNPEFIVHIPRNKELPTHHFKGWTSTLSKHIVQLFGDKGGIVTTSPSVDLWIAKGVKTFEDYVIEKVSGYIYLNPRIEEYYANHPDRIGDESNHSTVELTNFIRLIHTIPALMQKFGQINNLTEEDKIYLQIWDDLVYRGFIAQTETTADWLNNIPLSADSKKLIAKLKDNVLLEMLDMNRVRRIVGIDSTDPQAIKALGILIAVINN